MLEYFKKIPQTCLLRLFLNHRLFNQIVQDRIKWFPLGHETETMSLILFWTTTTANCSWRKLLSRIISVTSFINGRHYCHPFVYMQISLPGPDFEWKGVLLRLALSMWLSKSWNNVSSYSRDFSISSFMNDISSLVGSFWTASLTRVNTSVVAESSLFLDNCLLFVFIRTNSSFSLTLSSEISTDKSLGELEAEGSSAKSGWQDSLVFTTSKRVVNHLPNPWSSWNRLIPVADFCVRAACLHKETFFELASQLIHREIEVFTSSRSSGFNFFQNFSIQLSISLILCICENKFLSIWAVTHNDINEIIKCLWTPLGFSTWFLFLLSIGFFHEKFERCVLVSTLFSLFIFFIHFIHFYLVIIIACCSHSISTYGKTITYIILLPSATK